MILIRLPWRHRARASATLHEIPSAPKGKLVLMMLHGRDGLVNRKLMPTLPQQRVPHSCRVRRSGNLPVLKRQGGGFDFLSAIDDSRPHLSFRRASEARQEESAVRREAPLTVSPVPNTEVKPRRADGTARAKCVRALRQAQGKLRSLPALIKAVERNLDGLFLLSLKSDCPRSFASKP